MRAILSALLAAASLTACQTATLEGKSEALLSGDIPSAHQEISAVIAQQLGRPSVTLSDTAFVKSPNVIIERAFAGPIADGRRMDRPDHFRLMIGSNICYLYHEESQTLTRLKSVSCAYANFRPAE